MPSVFSRIVAGEIPCHKVYEDERHIAFHVLDRRPGNAAGGEVALQATDLVGRAVVAVPLTADGQRGGQRLDG